MPLPAPSSSSCALVTGGSAGIGLDVARELARRGHGLALAAREEGPLRERARELAEAFGVRVTAHPCDLTVPASREALARALAQEGRAVEVLVHNAGFATIAPIAESVGEDLQREVRLLCEAVVDLTTTYLPGMLARRRGAILTMSSVAGFQPAPGMAVYAAAKAFTFSFGEALHAELEGTGVTATTCCPGPVRTGIWSPWPGNPVEQRTPTRLWQDPHEVARAAVAGLEAGDRVVLPSIAARAALLAARLLPHGASLALSRRFLRAT